MLIPPPVRQMIREAVENLGSPTTNTALRDWIEARYPSGPTCSLRDMDRYLWLTGQYREWRRDADGETTNSELRLLFEDQGTEAQELLRTVWPNSSP